MPPIAKIAPSTGPVLSPDDNTIAMEVGGSIRASDAMGALLVPGNHVGTQVSVADPLALVRQQMAASTAAPSTPASEAAPSVANGNMRFSDFLILPC